MRIVRSDGFDRRSSISLNIERCKMRRLYEKYEKNQEESIQSPFSEEYVSPCNGILFLYNTPMPKRKTQKHSWMTIELQNILAGGILITLSALMFLATKETSVVGGYFSIMGETLFGREYRWIFSPLLAILGTMILIKKASW